MKYQGFLEAMKLQWGHDFSAVEILCMEKTARRAYFSFNGATTFQPWKCGFGHAIGNTFKIASMGPRLFSRGNVSAVGNVPYNSDRASMGPRLFSRGNPFRHFLPGSLTRSASMGPRLFSRGNSCGCLRRRGRFSWLQWGHDFSAVEIAAIFWPRWISKNWPFSRGSSTLAEFFSKCVGLRRSFRCCEALRALPGPPGTT